MPATSLEQQLFSLPLWLIGLLTLAGLALAVATGRWLSLAWRRRFGLDEPDRPSQNFILSASLGLLSLLLAFTFSMAANNFDKRRAMVTEESGAIAGVYLLAQSFDEPHRSRISSFLGAYVGNRLALGRARDAGARTQLLRQSESLQAHVWAAALVAARNSENPIEAIFLNTTQQAINTGTARDATRWGHHIPARVKGFLVVYMLVTAILLGFQTSSTKPLVMGATLLLLLTLATVLILDLDSPTEGAIVEMQEPMQRLHARIARGTPAELDSLADHIEAGR